ncbi:MAG: type II toxin-antitoxin system RelE/ParE family toxin [Gammaproteobacteria bacterium]|nr:type II toxin-antitoxin system RelE/ParE family toxin [Gammaproteobacteria bacterium]
MICGFRHRGLQRLHECDDPRSLNAAHVDKIRRILARLEVASVPGDMNLPGWRLHRLKGNRAGFWSVAVQANWRVIFRFERGNATDIDYLDYH